MFRSSGSRFFALSVGLLVTVVSAAGTSCSFSDLFGNSASEVTVLLAADFEADDAAKRKNAASTNPCPAVAPDNDSPDLLAGLDCDGDGGVVQYVTPSTYKVAIKRLAFLRVDGGDPFEAIPDTGTLAAAEVLDITNPVELEIEPPPAGVYSQFLVELYYFELTMPMYDADAQATIRVYMSDDDFPAEGSLGHHQGDITLIDENGDELGFVDVAMAWQVGSLLDARGTLNGGGGTDPETGHLRGLFGDASFWNQAGLQQGAENDVYRLLGPLNLTVGQGAQVVRFEFDVANTWFYEDFDGDERFNPCGTVSGDACNSGAAWAPLFSEPEPEVEDAASDDADGLGADGNDTTESAAAA